jgi:hypothetical protein
VGFFDRFYNPHCIRLAIEKLLHAGNNRRRSGTMSATGVRRDDQDFGNALRQWFFALCSLFFVLSS